MKKINCATKPSCPTKPWCSWRRSCILLVALPVFAVAQKQHEIKKWYSVSASEIIFSAGDLSVDSLSVDNVVRFSAFFHAQQQAHFNFSKHLGIYTGFGVRNVGFIHRFKVGEEDLKIKQRSYAAGIPLAIKIGNMEKGVYVALGGEAELMFNYKQKIFYDGEKSKKSEWFSDKVNLFNPSAFAEIRFKKGSYIRFKYYMQNFLTNKENKFIIPGTSNEEILKAGENKLFYIAIGSALKMRDKKKRKATKNEV